MEQTLADGRGLEHLAMPTDEQVLWYPSQKFTFGVFGQGATLKLQKSFSKPAIALDSNKYQTYVVATSKKSGDCMKLVLVLGDSRFKALQQWS